MWRISYELFTKCVTPNECHACALHNVVLTSRVSIWKFFWTLQNFLHDMARTTSPDSHRHASPHTVTSSSLIGTPNCVPWRKPFVVPLQACWRTNDEKKHLTAVFDAGATEVNWACQAQDRVHIRQEICAYLRQPNLNDMRRKRSKDWLQTQHDHRHALWAVA